MELGSPEGARVVAGTGDTHIMGELEGTGDSHGIGDAGGMGDAAMAAGGMEETTGFVDASKAVDL